MFNFKEIFSKIYFWKMVFSLILFLGTFAVIKNHGIWLLHSFDLAIHESGHLVLMFWAPEIIMFLGGTMMQLLFPLLFLKHYWKRFDQEFSFFVVLWWLGENLVDVGIYMGDAIPMQLHLLGNGRHDWNFIFSYFGVLEYSAFIGGLFYYIGILAMIVGVVFMFKFSLKEKITLN